MAKVILSVLRRGAQFSPALCINITRTNHAIDAECSRVNDLANDAVKNDRVDYRGNVCSFQDGVLRSWCTKGMIGFQDIQD